MYWESINDNILSIYNKLHNDNFSSKEKFLSLNTEFGNLIKKVKKDDSYNIEEYINKRNLSNINVKLKVNIKSIKKQIIRHLNNSNFTNEYKVLSISDYSLGINVINDFNIKYMLFIKSNDNNINTIDLIKISNILGLHGFELIKQFNEDIYEFKSNVKKFCVKIYVNFIEDIEKNFYYKIYNKDDIVNNDVISFIKYNIMKFSKQDEIKFNIVFYNFLLHKIKYTNTFLIEDYHDF